MGAGARRFPFVGGAEILRTGRTPAPLAYGQDAAGLQDPVLKTLTFPLDTAMAVGAVGSEQGITADFVWAIAGTNAGVVDPTAMMNIRFNQYDSDDVPINLGVYIEIPINKFWVSWTAQAGKKITLVYGRPAGFIQNPAVAVNSVTVTGTVLTADKATTFATFADVAVANATQVQILAALAGRRRATLVNTGANFLRMGDSNTGAAQGALVPPNGSVDFKNTQALFAYGSGGASSVGGFYEAD